MKTLTTASRQINIRATVRMGEDIEPMYELFVVKSDDLHEVITEDGLGTDVNACVGLRRVDGKEWHHGRLFTGGFEHMEDESGFYADIYRSASAQAWDLIDKIKAHGTVDLSKWDAFN